MRLVKKEKVLADEGKKIDAIKALKARTGVGLKEAYDKITDYMCSSKPTKKTKK